MNDDNLESFLNASIELLSSSHFFDKFLHNNSILAVSITWSDFYVKVATEYYTFNNCGASWACFEFFMFTLDLVHKWSLI